MATSEKAPVSDTKAGNKATASKSSKSSKKVDRKKLLIIFIVAIISFILGVVGMYIYLNSRERNGNVDQSNTESSDTNTNNTSGNDTNTTNGSSTTPQSTQNPQNNGSTPPSNGGGSNPAPTTPAPFTVTAANITITPAVQDLCPATFYLEYTMTANSAGTANYRYVTSDGLTLDASMTFTQAGTVSLHDVASDFIKYAPVDGWIRIDVLSPNAMSSNQANYSLTCSPAEDFSGDWAMNFGSITIYQTDNYFTGAYWDQTTDPVSSGSVSGTVVGSTLSGTYTVNGASGNFSWYLLGNGVSFNGTKDGWLQWCGARGGEAFPEGCGFSGHWNVHVLSACDVGDMDLVEIAQPWSTNTVSGTYCYGTVYNGQVYYQDNSRRLWSRWHSNGNGDGTLRFRLNNPLSVQYLQGFYNEWTTYYWCGWKDGTGMPDPCFF